MVRPKTHLEFTNIHGQRLGCADEIELMVRQAAEQRHDVKVAVAVSLTPAEIDKVFDALVLAGCRRGKTALMTLLRALDMRRDMGRAFNGAEVGDALRQLHGAGRVLVHEGDGWSVPAAIAEPRLATLLARPGAGDAWRALLWVASGAIGPIERVPTYFTPRDDDESVALVRLVLLSGIDAKGYAQLAAGPLRRASMTQTVLRTLAQLLRLGLYHRVDGLLRWQLLGALDRHGSLAREPALLAWVGAHIDEAPAAGATGLRLWAAEQHLQRGDAEGMTRAIAATPASTTFSACRTSCWPTRSPISSTTPPTTTTRTPRSSAATACASCARHRSVRG